MLLPIIGTENPGTAEPTMLIPAVGYGSPDATMIIPVAPSRHRADDTTVVVGAPPGDGGDSGSTVSPSLARNSATMAIFSLISRVTGLIRTVAIAAALGASLIANSYNLANTVPNMVYELLLGGIMSSVLVPFLMRSRLRHSDGGTADAQRLLTLAFTFLGAGTVVGGRGRTAAHPTLHDHDVAQAERRRPAPDHDAELPDPAGDLLLRRRGAARGDPLHPRPLRGADVDADPQQRRRHRDRRPLHR